MPGGGGGAGGGVVVCLLTVKEVWAEPEDWLIVKVEVYEFWPEGGSPIETATRTSEEEI